MGRRRELRAQRLGHEPDREPAAMDEYRPPLKVEGDTFCCNHCDAVIGPVADGWKANALIRRWPITELAARLGAKVRETHVITLEDWEFLCPSCGSLLEVDTHESGDEPPRDIELGARREEPGEAF